MEMTFTGPPSFRLAALLAGGVLVSVLAGCGERPPEKAKSTSLVAKVNGQEITLQQIDAVMRGIAGGGAAATPGVRRQLLERLIDQELAVQKALETHLDRNPGVVEAVDGSRRDILARAYVEQAAALADKPSAEAIQRFHDTHPELFAARKVYRLEEFAFSVTPELKEQVRSLQQAGKPAAEIVAALKERGIDVVGGVTVKAAEQIALEILPQIAIARVGQPQLFETNGRAALITVLGSKAEPLDSRKALASAEDYLLRMQRNQAASKAIKGMRDVATIEYFGEFSAVNLAMGEVPRNKDADRAAGQAQKGWVR